MFEEPGAHSFPYYTKYLAELIASDSTNQYFVVTHNLYFLLALLEKTSLDQLAVFVTYLEDYQSKLKRLSVNALQEILSLDIDPFFDLEALQGE